MTTNNETMKVVAQEETIMENNGMAVETIVEEKDFPQQGTRLQQLLSSYRKENNMPVPQHQDNSLANVKVTNEVSTRTFDELTEVNKQKVLQRIDGIDYLTAGDIMQFGSAKESPLTKHAEVIISKYSASDAGEIADPLTNLVATLKTNNPQEIVKNVSVDTEKNWGIFSSIREVMSLKKARKKMALALAEHDSISNNIKAVEVELEKQKMSLATDIKVYEQMGRSTFQQIDDFELDCIALQLMIDEAQAKLDEYLKKSSLNQSEMYEAQTLKGAIERMNRKMYSIQAVRTSNVQSLPQLTVLIRGDEIICEKIDEVRTLVIPLWTWQYAIAIGAIKQQEALNIQKTIRGITSKLLTGNAKLLHDNMIAAQEELYAAAVAIEDLQIVQGYIDDMVSKVGEARQQAAQKSVEGMKTMRAIEQKNYELMKSDISNK